MDCESKLPKKVSFGMTSLFPKTALEAVFLMKQHF
jgi:hypothetical protein